ncbi:MAG: hypothetical protein PUB69_00195 [Desulfovibrionaceae bacterium]|nr:hypothetical protein [Desulfovibrionaceae bacterium]
MSSLSIPERIGLFPRGLEQPSGSYRSGSDAIILAEFALQSQAIRSGQRTFAELGCGCGMASLALLLRNAALQGWGLDCFSELTDAAARNAVKMGCSDRFAAVCGDVADTSLMQKMRRLRYAVDLVLCNPPWRLEKNGRLPLSPMRRQALFGNEETLLLFCRAGRILLRPQGAFCMICGAFRTADAFAALRNAGLTPVRLRAVQKSMDAPARWILLEARSGGGSMLCVEPPLLSERQ